MKCDENGLFIMLKASATLYFLEISIPLTLLQRRTDERGFPNAAMKCDENGFFIMLKASATLHFLEVSIPLTLLQRRSVCGLGCEGFQMLR